MIRTSKRLLVSAAANLMVMACPAQAASFDCTKTQLPVEKLICSDAELSKLDEHMATAYTLALKNKSQAAAIKQSQRTWLRYQGILSNTTDLQFAYRNRIAYLAKAALSNASFTVIEDEITSTWPREIGFCQTMVDNLNSMPSWPPAYCERPLNPAFTKLKQLKWRTWSLEEFDKRWHLIAEATNDDNRTKTSQRWTDQSTQDWRESIRNNRYVVEETELPENTELHFPSRRLLRLHSTVDGLEAMKRHLKKVGKKPWEIHEHPMACNADLIIPLSDDGATVKTSATTGRGALVSAQQLWLYEIEPGKHGLFEQYWSIAEPGFKTGVLSQAFDTCKIRYTKPMQTQTGK